MRTLRPSLVAIRLRKPCSRFRGIRFGWYVRFMQRKTPCSQFIDKQIIRFGVRRCQCEGDRGADGGTGRRCGATYDGDGARRKRLDTKGTIHYVGPYERSAGNGQDVTEVVTKCS